MKNKNKIIAFAIFALSVALIAGGWFLYNSITKAAAAVSGASAGSKNIDNLAGTINGLIQNPAKALGLSQ